VADTRIRALGLGNPPVGDLSLTPTPRPDKGFVEEMKAALGRVNKLQMEANQAIQDLANDVVRAAIFFLLMLLRTFATESGSFTNTKGRVARS